MLRHADHPFPAAALGWLFTAWVTVAATESPAWIHRAWQTEDGLPDNTITGVAQTADGYLWVATKGGLLRFNGAEFTTVPVLELPGVPSRAVRSMFCDRDSRLWLAMERGPLLRLEPRGVRAFTAEEGLIPQLVGHMAEDQEGALWLAYFAQLRRIQGDEVTHPQMPPGLGEGFITSMVSDINGQVWIAKGATLCVFRDGAIRPVTELKVAPAALYGGASSGLWLCARGSLFKFEEGQELKEVVRCPGGVTPQAFLEDRSGVLWIGTFSDGLFRLEAGQWESVSTSHQDVTCLTEDREGNLWAGTTGGGLNLIRPRAVAVLGREAGLPAESLQSVCEDQEGSIWVVLSPGGLACGRGEAWELVSATPDWPGGRATCVAPDPQGGVWVGTSDQGLHHYRAGRWRTWREPEGLGSSNVRSLLVSATGDLWVATSGPDRLMQLHDGTLRGIERQGRVGAIRALAETGDGTVWVGTAEGLLLRVEGGSLVNEPAIRERITLSIRSLHATQDGSLWIGYAGDGLGRLKRGRHARLTTADGLLDDFVSQLQSDASGFLWVLGNRGLSRVGLAEVEAVMDGQKERVRSRIYGRTDGLPALQPARDHSPASWRARDGRLWFSTRNGLLVVHPDKIQENLEPPPVRVERVTVDDQLRALHGARSLLYPVKDGGLVELGGPSQSLTLGPEHSKLGIEFAGLSFSSPENVQFRYRLSGFDPRWIEAGSDRRVTYPRLSAGDYEFHVQACNNAGVWNETGATLALSVQPFLWETWWFRTGAGLSIVVAAGGSVFLVARRRYRRKLLRLEARRAIEQERARIAKDIHDDLGASLTRITLLSQPTRGESEEGSGAAENLEQIHATARELTQAMGEVVWAVNPEHDSFDGLVNYLSNYAQSFLGVAGLRCRLEMPMRLPSQVLSAELRHNLFLAFKEALNNVVRHAAATEVRVSLTPDESGFTLQVEDNGRGFPRSAPPVDGTANPPVRANRGNGLANMHTRLREIGGSCELEGSEGAGVKIRFRVPWRKHL